MQPILIIAPHTTVMETAVQVAKNNEKVQVEYSLLEDAIPIALAAESQGAQVIISRGGTTRLLERSELTIPVVDIALSPFNMLSAIHRARQLRPQNHSNGLDQNYPGGRKTGTVFLNVDLEIHEIYNRLEAENMLRTHAIPSAPLDVLLGGAVAESLATNTAYPTVFLETSQEDIESALEEACRLLEVRHVEAQKTEQFKAILDNINHGVIAVDRKAASPLSTGSREK